MGFMDQITGKISGGASLTDLAGPNLFQGISDLIGQRGGMGALVQKFQSNGLGEIIHSWVGTGKNLPISPEQIQSALGSETVINLAEKAGVSPEVVGRHLSQLLPNLIDRLTPSGQVSSEPLEMQKILSVGMELLKGKNNV